MSDESKGQYVICQNCGELLVRREDGHWVTREGYPCTNDELHEALGVGAGWFT